jgi:protein arginine kinase activator
MKGYGMCPYNGKSCNGAKIDCVIKKDKSSCRVCRDCPKKTPDTLWTKLVKHAGAAIRALTSFLQPRPRKKKARKTVLANRCPQCGTSVQDIIAIQKVGCSGCYHHFRDFLASLALNVHGASQHAGKKPVPTVAEQFEREMNKAVREERYEDALVLRDKLKAAREQLSVDKKENADRLTS